MSVIQITIDTAGKNFRGPHPYVDHEIVGREVARLLNIAIVYFDSDYAVDFQGLDAPEQNGMCIEIYG